MKFKRMLLLVFVIAVSLVIQSNYVYAADNLASYNGNTVTKVTVTVSNLDTSGNLYYRGVDIAVFQDEDNNGTYAVKNGKVKRVLTNSTSIEMSLGNPTDYQNGSRYKVGYRVLYTPVGTDSGQIIIDDQENGKDGWKLIKDGDTDIWFTRNTPPVITVTTGNNKIISATEPNKTITISGTVQYENVGEILKIYYRIDGSEGQSGTKLDTDITATGNPQAFNQEIDFSGQSEGDHKLYLWAEEPNGTKSSEVSRNFKVDKIAPTVSLTYQDQEGHTTEKYKQADIVTITAVFSEEILEAVSPQIEITGVNSQIPTDMTRVNSTTYTYVHTVGAGNGLASCRITSAKDLAGNVITQTTPTSGNSFTVDNTAPTVSLSYRDQDIHTNGIYKQGDTVTVTATFNEDIMLGVLPQIEITGTNSQAPTDMTRVNSTTYTYVHTVGAGNGLASCLITLAKDLAGNVITQTTPTSGESFKVDNIAPTVLFSGGVDYTVASSIELADAQANEAGTLYLYKEGSPGFPTPTFLQLESGILNNNCIKAAVTIINTDTAITAPTLDGTYNLFAVDNAGNVSAASQNTVTVNRNIIKVNAPSATAISDTALKITTNASCENGLAAKPYRFNRNGSDIDTWTLDNPYTDDELSPNTRYAYKYKAKNSNGDESEYSEAISVYTLALNPESVSQISRTHNSIAFRITNASGQGVPPQHRLELKLKDAGESGENKGVSNWNSTTLTSIYGLSANTEYELWVQTRNGDKIENARYKVDGEFKTCIYESSSGENINKNIKSEIDGDNALAEAMQKTGKAKISLANDPDSLVQMNPGNIQSLINDDNPLIVENNDVSLNFAPQSLITPEFTQALDNPDANLEVGAKALTEAEKQGILNNAPLGGSTGIFDIGGKIFEFTAKTITKNPNGTITEDKIDTFGGLVAVTIDLTDLELTQEEIANLTGVRYEKDTNGKIVIKKLGGHYDPATKTFTFYTEKFSLYGVAKAQNITKINLTIGSLESTINGKKVTNDAAPVIINNRTMVPVRFIAENFGAKVEWVGETRTVVIKLYEKNITMVIDQSIKGFDTPPTIVNKRTLVPLRYVSEQLDAKVLWIPETKSIQIVR